MVSRTARKALRWTGKALLWLVVVLLVLGACGAVYQTVATRRAERDYPPPGQMVNVGGYSLHIYCVGRGSPTVILDGGTGEMSANWGLVQREVSRTTRVCSYDRAGMGWSERGPEPRDARRITSELHTLLAGAGIEGPYVLAGHSFGGLYMQSYAARYPDEVAGMSLIESSHPGQFGYRSVTRDSYEPPTRVPSVASLLARTGAVRLFYKAFPASADLPPEQRAQIDALAPSTRQLDTTALELRATPQTVTQARGLRSLGDRPLGVVSAGTQEPEWLELQADLAALSSNSTHRVVKEATHMSVLGDRDDARATSLAVAGVVRAVRNDRPPAR